MRSSALRIGDILVQQGVLTPEQVERILEVQGRRARPFGLLAERLFDIDPELIERAWATQYAMRAAAEAEAIAPETTVRDRLTRRQAWQFRIVPLHIDADGDLVLATDDASLPRALRFARAQFGDRVHFRIASPEALDAALRRDYGWPGTVLGRRRPVALQLREAAVAEGSLA